MTEQPRATRAVSADRRLRCHLGDYDEYDWLCSDDSGDIGNWAEYPDTGQTAEQVLAQFQAEREEQP